MHIETTTVAKYVYPNKHKHCNALLSLL